MCSGHQSFIMYLFCRYFLLACVLGFHFINKVFQREDILNFEEVLFMFFDLHFLCPVKSLLNPRSQRFSPVSFYKFYSFRSYV